MHGWKCQLDGWRLDVAKTYVNNWWMKHDPSCRCRGLPGVQFAETKPTVASPHGVAKSPCNETMQFLLLGHFQSGPIGKERYDRRE